MIIMMYMMIDDGADDVDDDDNNVMIMIIMMRIMTIIMIMMILSDRFSGEFPSQRSSNADFDVSFDMGQCKLLNKQSTDRWFDNITFMWLHRNETWIYFDFQTDLKYVTCSQYFTSMINEKWYQKMTCKQGIRHLLNYCVVGIGHRQQTYIKNKYSKTFRPRDRYDMTWFPSKGLVSIEGFFSLCCSGKSTNNARASKNTKGSSY